MLKKCLWEEILHFFLLMITFLCVQLTFAMGLSYLPLAQVGLEALEWWSQVLPSDIIAAHYADILPCLDAYLKTADTGSTFCSPCYAGFLLCFCIFCFFVKRVVLVSRLVFTLNT